MKVNGCKVNLYNNDPGFTLPSTIGELGDITTLDLSSCSLRGSTPTQKKDLTRKKNLRQKTPQMRSKLHGWQTRPVWHA